MVQQNKPPTAASTTQSKSTSTAPPLSGSSVPLPPFTAQKVGAASSAPTLFDTTVEEMNDGSLELVTLIPPDIARRLKSRAYQRDLAEYIRTQILVSSFTSHVY